MAQRPSEKFQRRYHAWRDSIDIEEEITGKFGAVKPESQPPSKLSPLAIAWLLVRKFPPWGAVLVALAGIAAYVLLRR